MNIFQKISLFVTPFLATSLIATLPSKAVTLANSQGVFDFTGFSQNPSGTFAGVNANTSTIGNTVFADATAVATFVVEPAEASNFSSATALGELGNYLGLAESEATVIGNFDIQAHTSFSFNFSGLLSLLTSIDDPLTEKANALGEISFALVDIETDTLLDAFSFVGNLNTPGNSDYIAYDKIGNIVLNNANAIENIGGNQEDIRAVVEGYYQRNFANSTKLALIEVKRNRAEVQASVPEPSAIFGLFISSGVIGVVLRTKRKETQNAIIPHPKP